jgi:hypothetical protein
MPIEKVVSTSLALPVMEVGPLGSPCTHTGVWKKLMNGLWPR